MKFYLIISLTTILLFAFMLGRRGGCVVGQLYEDPSQHFKNFTFDSTLRGSFNLSACVKEMINCFELVRPEFICEHNQVMHDSVCGVMRQMCHDYYGHYDSYNHKFQMYTQYCRYQHAQDWT